MNNTTISQSSNKGRKRQREEEIEAENSDVVDHTISLKENLTFSYTLVALHIMRAQFPHIDKTRQLIDPNMYWFAIPSIGLVLKGLSQGRKELLPFLDRRRYKEMMLAPLEKKCLGFSPLDMRFHLRDLAGSGHLKIVQTPTGLVVRVSKD